LRDDVAQLRRATALCSVLHAGSAATFALVRSWQSPGAREVSMPVGHTHLTLLFVACDLLVAAGCGSNHQQPEPDGSAPSDDAGADTESDGSVAGSGIASNYPFDQNIASDPDVLYADDFESYATTSDLTSPGHWSRAQWSNRMRIATETANQHPHLDSHKSLEMSLPISETELSIALVKDLVPTQDVVYARMYQRYDAGYNSPGSNHNGVRISAGYPDVAGTAPPEDGTGYFLFLLQNNMTATTPSPGKSQLYVYWPKQRTRINGAPPGMQWGDIWTPPGAALPYIDAQHQVGDDGQAVGNRGNWLAFPNDYPQFQPMADFIPDRDKWYCVELMVKSNTPGNADGEVKFWIDGELKGDFTNLDMRSVASLKLDTVHIMLHAGRTTRLNTKWYDNVVIAKRYIGPMVR
jgi:hypothetical protein